VSEADDARALYQQARAAASDERFGDAIAAFGELVERFPQFDMLAARALNGKAWCLEKIERDQAAVGVFDEILERFGDSGDDGIRRQVARALFSRGVALSRLGQDEAAIASWDDLLGRFGPDDAEPEFGRRVWGALERKAAAMRRLEHLDEALEAYDEIVIRFTTSEYPQLRRQADIALSNKAFVLLVDGRIDEAIVVAKAAVGRLGTSEDPSALAIAVLNLGGGLVKEQRLTEAMNVYDALIDRLEATLSPERHWHLILATSNKVEVLAMMDRTDDAVELHKDLVGRFGDEVPKAFAEAAARNEHDEAAVDIVAGMLLKEAVVLAELGKGEQSLIALNNLIGRYAEEEGEEIERVVDLAREFREQLIDGDEDDD
jgi:tetratricopeptide (TPR) repeat protein